MKSIRPWQSLKNLFANHSRAARRRAAHVSHRPAEFLEQRQLLSATMMGPQKIQAPVTEPGFELKEDGTLIITGSEGNDSFSLRNNWGNDANGQWKILSRTIVMEGDGTTKTFQLTDQVKQIRAALGAGNDTFYANWWSGIDVPLTVFGEGGDDSIYGSSNADILNGGDGNDVISGYGGNDVLIGGDGNDVLDGGDGNDTVYAGRGNDILKGGAGNDVLNGQGGRDTLSEYDIQQIVYAYGNRSFVTLDAITNTSETKILGKQIALTDSQLRTGSGENNDSMTPTFELDTLSGIEAAELTGSSLSDRIDTSLFSGSVTLNGGDGNDTLIGGRGNDVISGGYGDDVIEGGVGNDQLDGQQGNDVVRGGDGNDFISGGGGNDTLDGQTGRDTLVESTDQLNESNERPVYKRPVYWWGNREEIVDLNLVLSGKIPVVSDTTPRFTVNDQSLQSATYEDSLVGFEAAKIMGGWNAEVIDASGFSGSVTLDGGSGDDTLWGGRGDDVLLGGDGNDVLHGGGGHDKLRGQAGSDRLFGEDGNDTLDGGAGHDLLEGGAGNDRYQAFDNAYIYQGDAQPDPLRESDPEGGDVIVAESRTEVAHQRRMDLDQHDVVITRGGILRNEAATDALFAGQIGDLLAALKASGR